MVTLFEIFKRRKLYILAPTLMVAAAVAIYAFYLPPLYRAQALLAVELPASESAKAKDPANGQEQLRTIKEVMLSRPVLEAVITEFRLAKEGDQNLERALEEVKPKVKVQSEEKDTFSVSFEGTERQQVAGVTNKLAELFITRASTLREKRMEKAAKFLQAEVERVGRDLADQESRIDQYKERAIQELPEQMATNLRMLETLQVQLQTRIAKLNEEEGRRAGLLSEIAQLEKQGALNSGQTKPKSLAAAKLEERKLALRELQTRYKERYPEVIRLNREISELESAVQEERGTIHDEPSPAVMRYLGLKAELEATEQRLKGYRQEKDDLTRQIALQQKRIASGPRHERSLAELTRDYQITRTQYSTLLQKQQEAQVAARLEETNQGVTFRILEPAEVPTSPYTPKRFRIMLMGLLGGLTLGLLLAFVAEQADTSFDNAQDFQSFTNLPVLAVIPSIPALRSASNRIVNLQEHKRKALEGISGSPTESEPQPGFIVTLDASSGTAEQYRILGLKARLRLGDDSSKILVISSATPREGKTITAINLSMALLQALDEPVLLVDCDLRRPLVHKYLNINVEKSFSDLLAQPDDDLSDYIQKINGLCVIAGDSRLKDPIARLASPQARAVMARLRQEFRYVVLDSPAILPTADTHVLAGIADGMIIVVRARQTRRELFRRAMESLDTSNVLGIVFNDADYKYSHPVSRFYPEAHLREKAEGSGSV
jgi:polysaccharide chain length determinant protein (PEP-CTERM system associated)